MVTQVASNMLKSQDTPDIIQELIKQFDLLKEIEGFPNGSLEDIMKLSEPPLYTACPNPFIKDFITNHGSAYIEETDNYIREPFTGDVSYGRNDPMLNAHFYHTKVPPSAIQEFIEHFTDEGDIVLDGFAGTGTTGIAANRTRRFCILIELSPIASFICRNLTKKIDSQKLIDITKEIELNVRKRMGWLYSVNVNGKPKEINYTIWSDAFLCPYCGAKYFYFDKFVNFENNEVHEVAKCSSCHGDITPDNQRKAFIEIFDPVLNKTLEVPEQKPVLISYFVKGRKKYKEPDEEDLLLIDKINSYEFSAWFPSSAMMFTGENWGDLWRAGYHKGYTHSHLFYTKRNLLALSEIFEEIKQYPIDIQGVLKFVFSSLYSRSHRMNRYTPQHGRHVGPLSGTLYMSSLQVEINVFNIFKDKSAQIIYALNETKNENTIVSTQSINNCSVFIPENSIDYIFTDPPFGDNLPYSELNFIMEDWLKIHTNIESETIINNKQFKDIERYNDLLFTAFKEYYKVLKPKRWITVVFHNSKTKIWASIQNAITRAGFIISSVSILDKKKGTTKQLSYVGAVKNDLVISAFKPSQKFEDTFIKQAGDNLEVDFIDQFLSVQPIKPILERTDKMLYSKMLAYYIQRGYEIRYDAKSFYHLLNQHFASEDGFWFTSGQINSYIEYKKRMKLEGIDDVKSGKMMLFVTDEKSAILWLFNFLSSPHTFAQVHTPFYQLANIQGDEVPELFAILEENFVNENGSYRRPMNEPEHNTVAERREKALMREFESLLIKAKTERGKIKSVRKEALSLGFENCYKARRFEDILSVSSKLDKSILENNSELNDFVDAAEIMVKGIS